MMDAIDICASGLGICASHDALVQLQTAADPTQQHLSAPSAASHHHPATAQGVLAVVLLPFALLTALGLIGLLMTVVRWFSTATAASPPTAPATDPTPTASKLSLQQASSVAWLPLSTNSTTNVATCSAVGTNGPVAAASDVADSPSSSSSSSSSSIHAAKPDRGPALPQAVPPVDSPDCQAAAAQVKTAAATGAVERLGLLVSAADAGVRTEALEEALWQQQEAAVQLLLEAGASATAPTDSGGNTPLHMASRQGNKAAVKILLAAGARPTATNSFLQTPLHSAAAFGHTAVVKQLLLQGAAVDAASREGATPLTEAVQGNHLASVAVLLSHGADPLLADDSLRTPLYWAAVTGGRQVAQALCDALHVPAAAAAASSPTAAADADSVTTTTTTTRDRSSNSARNSSSSASSSRWSAEQVVASLSSCAMTACAHNQLPTFAVLMKELARREQSAVQRLFGALGAHSSAAAAAMALAWAEDVTTQGEQRAQLREWAADVVAERMASQQLLLAVAAAAKHLEQQWEVSFILP